MIDSSEFSEYQSKRSFLRRIWIVCFLVLFCLGLLFTRFMWLQIVHYENYSLRSETNRIKLISVPPRRGAIIDRHGVVLAYNVPAYSLEVMPSKVKDMDTLIESLQELVEISERDIRRFRQIVGDRRTRFTTASLHPDLSQEEVAVLSAQLYRFEGVEIKPQFVRRYPLGETASHVLGYIGKVTEDDVARLTESGEFENYRSTEYIGRVGIEAAYEQSLHGVTGLQEQEVTASGRPIRVLREIGALPGHLIQLSLDLRLQKLVEELYGDRRGAFVAIDPKSGEVLALVSKPTFNPNQFIEGFDQESWSALNDDALNRPLFHRAIGGTYPIGSTFKPFMALAGMQTQTRQAEEKITALNAFSLGGRSWRSPGGGRIDASRAIVTSNNYYFYSLAHEMGITKIVNFMAPWGFGQITGIDVSGEVQGILPSPEWKRSAFSKASDQTWYDGETVNVGIGQGHLRFTILQLASATATLANDGVQHVPHLLTADKNLVTNTSIPFHTTAPQRMDVDERYIEVVQNAMHEVTIQGTSRYAFLGAAYESAGKTGTAQAASIPQGQRYDSRHLSEYKRDHSLYIAFAPLDNPTIAIAAIVENGEGGSVAAAPLVRRALDYYLLDIYPSEEDISHVQNKGTGPPRGVARSKAEFDIIPAEQLIPLSTINVSAVEVNTWREKRMRVPQDSVLENQEGVVSHEAR